MMNKKIMFVLTAAICGVLLIGCGSQKGTDADSSAANPPILTAPAPAETAMHNTSPNTQQSGDEKTVTGEGSVAAKSAELIDISKYPLNAPFTQAKWEMDIAAIESLEGAASASYDSVYGGTTYTRDHSYKDRTGTIKYMFDDREALMCVAWTYVAENAEQLNSLYQEVHSDLVSTLGESGYQAVDTNNSGDVWYLESGDIIISCMQTESLQALQIAYLNPIVSKNQMIDAANAMEGE